MKQNIYNKWNCLVIYLFLIIVPYFILCNKKNLYLSAFINTFSNQDINIQVKGKNKKYII